MTAVARQLAQQAAQLASAVAPARLRALVDALEAQPGGDWPGIQRLLSVHVPHPHLQPLLLAFLKTWQQTAPPLTPSQLALLLLGAVQGVGQEREREKLELVWTGPDQMAFPLRRTEQALLEVIEAAQSTLLIVSFAVYQVPSIANALVHASQRGVTLQICVESPDWAGGHIAYNTLTALGADVRRRATVYLWPHNQRPVTPTGKVGALHVKCAVADQSILFISSANLTQHAFTLNMELGVLIRGGQSPATVWLHFQRLIEDGVLVKVA